MRTNVARLAEELHPNDKLPHDTQVQLLKRAVQGGSCEVVIIIIIIAIMFVIITIITIITTAIIIYITYFYYY